MCGDQVPMSSQRRSQEPIVARRHPATRSMGNSHGLRHPPTCARSSDKHMGRKRWEGTWRRELRQRPANQGTSPHSQPLFRGHEDHSQQRGVPTDPASGADSRPPVHFPEAAPTPPLTTRHRQAPISPEFQTHLRRLHPETWSNRRTIARLSPSQRPCC
jgi:hypothetical protein